MQKRSVIITGGGVGKRMGAAIPKQFVRIGKWPVLMHTMNRFHTFDPESQLILVLPSDQIGVWKTLCETYSYTVPHEVVSGGKERYHSVKNGLAVATGELIAVHDAVRPFVTPKVIQDCFEGAEKYRAAIPVISPKESIRKVDGDTSRAVDRSQYRVVQTPQCFSSSVLNKAYEQPYESRFTDDASVVERSGVAVQLIQGNEENIKLTVPIDLIIAEELLKTEAFQ